MKRIITLFLLVSLVFALCACGTAQPAPTPTPTPSPTPTPKPTSTPIPAPTPMPRITDSQIQSLVVDALYSKIGSMFNDADPGSCRMSINKMDKSDDGWNTQKITVYGNVTLYDKYGKLTNGWGPSVSGSYNHAFTVKITAVGDMGWVDSCNIDR